MASYGAECSQLPVISVVFLHPCARHYMHRWPSTHAMQLHWRNLESFTWIKVYMSHLGFNVMQFSDSPSPLGPPLLVGVEPHLHSCCSTKTIAGCTFTSSFFFCKRCRYESFNPLWTVQIYLDHSIFSQATHPSSRLHPCSRQAIHSFETLLRVDRCFVWPERGAKWHQVGPSSWSWKLFRVAANEEIWWLSFLAGWMFVRMTGQNFSLKAGWLASPILEIFALLSK